MLEDLDAIPLRDPAVVLDEPLRLLGGPDDALQKRHHLSFDGLASGVIPGHTQTVR